MKIVTAPENYATSHIKIFLAGGITNCHDWQQNVIDHLKYFEQYYPKLKNAIVYNPRREDFGDLSPEKEYEQILWEYRYLKACDIFTCFFDASESVQPITLYELGRWAHKKENIITVVEGYYRANDVLIQTALDGLDCYVRTPGEADLEHARTIAQRVNRL